LYGAASRRFSAAECSRSISDDSDRLASASRVRYSHCASTEWLLNTFGIGWFVSAEIASGGDSPARWLCAWRPIALSLSTTAIRARLWRRLAHLSCV
jgi:hypothetical protein